MKNGLTLSHTLTTAENSNRSARVLCFSMLALLFSACASGPPKVEEPVVFYPEAPDPPRIQFLRSVTRGDEIEGDQSSLDDLLFGKREIHKGVMAPYGSAVRDGRVYVCDIQQGVVVTLDFENKDLDYLRLDGRGQLKKPTNLAFADDGSLFIADMGRRQVVALDSNFAYRAEFGPFAEESRPVAVAVHGDRLYIADSGSKCVRVLDRNSGEELLTIGREGGVRERLRSPTNLAVSETGEIYVVDTIDCRISIWSPEGKFLRHIGSPGNTVGQFARPKGIALLGDLIFIIDAAFENCQILDKQGNPLMFFGGSGLGPGNMYLPSGIWIGSDGLDQFEDRLADDFEASQLIVVTNLYGPRKVNFYAFGKSTEFQYPD